MRSFGNESEQGAENNPFPWLSDESIYSQIKEHLDPVSDQVESFDLSDTKRRFAGHSWTLAPGFAERFRPTASDPEDTARIVSSVIEIARKNSQNAQRELYDLLLKDNVLAFIDTVIDQFQQFGVSPQPYLYDFVIALAHFACDRGPVKFAIAMLSAIGNANDIPLLVLLGKHDEFTLYAAISLRYLTAQAELLIWELAQKVTGWGRVHAVRQLSETISPVIKKWLLYEGFHTSLMRDEGLAFIAATTGDLKTALSADPVNDDLLRATGEILSGLIIAGSGADLDSYNDAAFVVSRYLTILEPHATSLEQFVIAHLLLGYLTSKNWTGEEWRVKMQQNGWTEQIRSASIQTAERILKAPYWKAVVDQGLASEDNAKISRAKQVADMLGINI